MEEDIQREGVHNAYTHSLTTGKLSRISLWISHELPPGTAAKLTHLVEEAAMQVVRDWVRP